MSDDTLEINGWTVYAHPRFLDQLEAMLGSVEDAREGANGKAARCGSQGCVRRYPERSDARNISTGRHARPWPPRAQLA